MKTKIKNCVFWVLGVSFLFLSSCQKEDLELETKSHQHLKAEFISTNQLLNELKNPNVLDFVRNNLFHSIEQNKLLRTNESTNLFQKIVLPEYTTYTYKIDYYNPLKPIIKYFIITKDKNGIEKACYVNYTPSNYTYKLDLSKFSGKLEMFTVENELYSSTVYLNGKPFKDNDPNKIQYQTEVCFSSTTITLVACTGGAGHSGVGETCFDGLPSNAFYSVSTTMTCIDTPGVAYIAAPSEYGGGGAGGGGGFEGINIPTPYQGEPDLGNAEWVFASQVGMFTNTLPGVVQNVLTQNWWLFPNIVQWFKDNGFTQQNKLAIANAILKLDSVQNTYIPNATVIEINQLHYFAFMFFANNPTVTFAQFQNWYIPVESEGKDGDYDAAFWDNPNLVLPQQSLPTFANYLANYPKVTSPTGISNMLAPQVYQLVGGSILANHLSPNIQIRRNYENACSIRGSRALNYSNNPIPVITENGVQKTEKGGDDKNYILSAKAFNKYMHKTYGEPTLKLTKVEIDADPKAIADFLTGKTGIYSTINISYAQAGYGGHADIIINGTVLGGAHTDAKGGVEVIEIWILN